jgi:hypothetical protein
VITIIINSVSVFGDKIVLVKFNVSSRHGGMKENSQKKI